jgi:hypothetical protein
VLRLHGAPQTIVTSFAVADPTMMYEVDQVTFQSNAPDGCNRPWGTNWKRSILVTAERLYIGGHADIEPNQLYTGTPTKASSTSRHHRSERPSATGRARSLNVSLFDVRDGVSPRMISRPPFATPYISEDYAILDGELPEDQDRIQKAFRVFPDGLVVFHSPRCARAMAPRARPVTTRAAVCSSSSGRATP